MPDLPATPALSSFAAQVALLKQSREEQLPTLVGAMVPTYNRPDLLRACVLQLAAQSRPPDIICVHQNGHPESYRWAIEDLQVPSKIAWLHTAATIAQHQWYAIPLRYLIEKKCTHFFWIDHDDLYLRNHVAFGLEDLKDHDLSVSRRCGVLYTRAREFRYGPEVEFPAHPAGGMSSSICFNRRFAREMLVDICADTQQQHTDNVVARVTLPKFRHHVSTRRTCIYHSHEGSLTSHGWLEKVFP